MTEFKGIRKCAFLGAPYTPHANSICLLRSPPGVCCDCEYRLRPGHLSFASHSHLSLSMDKDCAESQTMPSFQFGPTVAMPVTHRIGMAGRRSAKTNKSSGMMASVPLQSRHLPLVSAFQRPRSQPLAILVYLSLG